MRLLLQLLIIGGIVGAVLCGAAVADPPSIDTEYVTPVGIAIISAFVYVVMRVTYSIFSNLIGGASDVGLDIIETLGCRISGGE